MSMIQRFLRDGTPAGVLQVVDGEWNAGVDGTDTLTITCLGELNKGDFVMWADDDGNLHEHEISESSVSHTSGVALVNATGINSVSELYGVQLPWLSELDQPVRQQVSNFMETFLFGNHSLDQHDPRWVWGSNGPDDDLPYGFPIDEKYFVVTFEEKESLRSALAKIASYLGAEMRAVVTKENGEYVRTIYMYQPMNQEDINAYPVKRFTFGKNVNGIKRDISGDTLYSAVHAYGAAIKDEAGEETGNRYECYSWGTDDQKNAYGYRGADGAMHHSVAIYENSDIDNLTDLQAESDRYLAYVSQPQVTYTCDIANVEGVKLGDYVDIIDTGFVPELRKRARVTSIKQKILEPTRSGTVVIGKKRDTFESAVVKAHAASKSDPNSDAHEEASTISKLDSQVNNTDGGIAQRLTNLEGRNATDAQTGFVKPDGTTTTVDSDGTIHASGGGGGGAMRFSHRTGYIFLDSLDALEERTTSSIAAGGTGFIECAISLYKICERLGLEVPTEVPSDITPISIGELPFEITSVDFMQPNSAYLQHIRTDWTVGTGWTSCKGGALLINAYFLNPTSASRTMSLTNLSGSGGHSIGFQLHICHEYGKASTTYPIVAKLSDVKAT
jgi:hypothetical protein